MWVKTILQWVSRVIFVIGSCVAVTLIIGQILPAGEQIVFSARDNNQEQLYLLDLNYGITIPAVQIESDEYQPVWSPDGSQLLVTHRQSQSSDALMISALPGRSQILYDAEENPGRIRTLPVWSQDNNDVAFLYDQTTLRDLIWAQLETNTLLYADISGLTLSDTELAWYGEQSVRLIARSNDQISLIELHLGDSTPQIIRSWQMETMSSRVPVISPDGKRFILPAVTSDARNFELYLFDTDTDQIINLTEQSSRNDTRPVWSADGERILYMSVNDAGQFLRLYDLNSGEDNLVFHADNTSLTEINWLPDESSIVFIQRQNNERELCVLRGTVINCMLNERSLSNVAWRPG